MEARGLPASPACACHRVPPSVCRRQEAALSVLLPKVCGVSIAYMPASPSSLGPHAGYLLLPGHRGELAAALDRAILAHSGRSEESALEAVARQAGAALQVRLFVSVRSLRAAAAHHVAPPSDSAVCAGYARAACAVAAVMVSCGQPFAPACPHPEVASLLPLPPPPAGAQAQRAPSGTAAGCAVGAAAGARSTAAAGQRRLSARRQGAPPLLLLNNFLSLTQIRVPLIPALTSGQLKACKPPIAPWSRHSEQQRRHALGAL